MSKDELILKINEIIDFITNGEVEIQGYKFNGHPNFYLKHSQEEFNKELRSFIINKDRYNTSDVFYYLNHMFKYMLNEYDSHTQIYFMDKKMLPLKIRIIDNKPYIVDCNDSISHFRMKEIININGVDISKIIYELENIICYASDNYLKIMLEDYLRDVNILKSIPSIENKDKMIIGTTDGDIIFDLNNLDIYKNKKRKENYNLEIIGDIAVITYKSCSDEEKMKELIEQLELLENVNSYIIDLRGNSGGNSSINRYLVNFLKDKKSITLCDERVFSSAMMCLMDLKNIGSKVIGTNPGTTINHFGNCILQKQINNTNLKVYGSTKYFYYDNDMKCYGIIKEKFSNALEDFPNLLEPKFFNVDEIIEITLDDYKNENDPVLNYAINSLKEERKER